MTSSFTDPGLLQVYYGDGKGKTTAAFGQAVRMLGHGAPVVVVQFLKNTPSGELDFFQTVKGIQIFRGKGGDRFTFQMTEEELKETKNIHNDNLEKAWNAIQNWTHGLLVLDEGLDAYAGNLVNQQRMEEIILQRPPHVEVVITGHSLPEFFHQQGDYITHMQKQRHPYDQGIAARKGIEQ